MLLIRIASTNVLLLLTVLIAKVYCQLGQKIGPTIHENQNQGSSDISGLGHKLSGRQQTPRFDLIPYNLRNANNPPPPPSPAPTPGPPDLKVKVGGPDQNKPPQGPPTVPGAPGQGGPQLPQGAQQLPQGAQQLPQGGPQLPQGPPPATPTAKPPEAPSKPGGSTDFSASENGNGSGNEEKLHGLQKLVQELYVAQAQVQLEANEIQRAQAIAAAAQQALEEAANNVRMITAALQAAQQTVASAAIRAQTTQLQLAAHDQLLFAARQKVDALSSQIVSMQAEEGIQPTKMIVDLQALLNKLKEPLDDKQKPTPVPSLLGSSDIGKTKTAEAENRAEGKIIHSVPAEVEGENTLNIINFLRKRQQQQHQQPTDTQKDENESLESLFARSNDLIHYGESLLQDNSETAFDNSQEKKLTNENLKKQFGNLDDNEIKNLVNFIVSLEHKQDTSNSKQHANTDLDKDDYSLSASIDLDGIDPEIVAKSSNQKYMNNFLEAMKSSKFERLSDSQFDSELKDSQVKDYLDNMDENLLKQRRAVKNFDDVEYKESSDDDHIFNIENAMYIDSENFRDSQP